MKKYCGIITFFNMSQYVESSLTGIHNQNLMPEMLYVVNDSSMDGTLEQIEKVSKKLKLRCKILTTPENVGVSGARNLAISNILKDYPLIPYVLIFDGDDKSTETRAETQIEILEKSKNNFAATYAQTSIQYLNSYVRKTNAKIPGRITEFNDLAKFLFFGIKSGETKKIDSITIQTSSMAVKTHIFKKGLLFDESFRRNEDSDFALNLLFNGGEIYISDKTLVLRFSTQASYKNSLINYEYENKLLEKWGPWLSDQSNLEFARRWNLAEFSWHNKNLIKFCLQALVLVIKHPKIALFRFFKFGTKRLIHEFKL